MRIRLDDHKTTYKFHTQADTKNIAFLIVITLPVKFFATRKCQTIRRISVRNESWRVAT